MKLVLVTSSYTIKKEEGMERLNEQQAEARIRRLTQAAKELSECGNGRFIETDFISWIGRKFVFVVDTSTNEQNDPILENIEAVAGIILGIKFTNTEGPVCEIFRDLNVCDYDDISTAVPILVTSVGIFEPAFSDESWTWEKEENCNEVIYGTIKML